MKKTQQKILIFGDDPTLATGFARVVNALTDAVLHAGHIPVVVGLKASAGPYSKCERINALERGDKRGWATLEPLLKEGVSKIMITVGDPWDVQDIYGLKKEYPFYWVAYTPVEAKPYPAWYQIPGSASCVNVGALTAAADRVIAYTKFGKEAIEDMVREYNEIPGSKGREIAPRIGQIYHGVDTDFFSPGKQKRARRALGPLGIKQDDILFTCVKVNSSRAGFDTLLDAWDHYLRVVLSYPGGDRIKARSRLYLHTNISGGSYLLPAMLNRRGFLRDKSVVIDPSIEHGYGCSDDRLRDIYRSTDVFVSCSRGEGFGLPVAEAMACGVPVIIPEYAGLAEIIKNGGQLTETAAKYQPENTYTEFAIVKKCELAGAMAGYATDYDKRISDGKAAREEIEPLSARAFRAAWAAVVLEAVEAGSKIAGPSGKGVFV